MREDGTLEEKDQRSFFFMKLTEAIDLVEEKQNQLDAGNPVELGTLESEISTLCADINASKPALAKEAAPHVATLISKLDHLAAGLERVTQQESGQNMPVTPDE